MTEKAADTPLPQNGVAITKRATDDPVHRTYEVHQRERVGQSTEKIQPIALISADQLLDPFANLTILRENYPCYRDWLGNSYWLTRFDDVTSVFADRANFAATSRAHACGLASATDYSRSVGAHSLWGELIDRTLPGLIEETLDALAGLAEPDLALDYAGTLADELRRRALGIASDQREEFRALMWHIERADSPRAAVAEQGRKSISTLAQLIDGIDSPLAQACPEASPSDLLTTLLGFDARTLFAGTTNLLHRWLTDPAIRRAVQSGHQAMKIACLESLRYSPPVPFAEVRARHEVERFGRLLPEGALLRLSALAANRDPRQFESPDTFIADRRDLCHREARGQYRADGLATAVAFGTGLPSRHPAVPEDRPRSIYALTRDAIVLANEQLVLRYPDIALADRPAEGEAQPYCAPRSLDLFGTWAAWQLPVRLNPTT